MFVEDEDEDFYFLMDLKLKEFYWPCWGADSDWSLTTMSKGTYVAVREQEYNQQQQHIKHAFQCKSIST